MARRDADAEDEARRLAAQLQIRQYPDPVLKQRSREVEAYDDDLRALADRMLRLMHDAHGAGLAAPQIGLLRRVFVYQAAAEADPVVLVNPEIVEASDERTVEDEGCLSLEVLIRKGVQVPVERPVRVTLRARDLDGETIEHTLEGHEARVVQHEVDHLDGTLIIDRAEQEPRREAMRTLRAAIGA